MEDVLVPIALFLMPVLIVGIVSFYNARRRATVHETLRHAIDNGQALSPEILEKMSLLTDPVRADLRRGVLFLAFGTAFAVLGILIGEQEADAITPMLGIATFPIFLGLAYIGLWAFSRDKNTAQ